MLIFDLYHSKGGVKIVYKKFKTLKKPADSDLTLSFSWLIASSD